MSGEVLLGGRFLKQVPMDAPEVLHAGEDVGSVELGASQTILSLCSCAGERPSSTGACGVWWLWDAAVFWSAHWHSRHLSLFHVQEKNGEEGSGRKTFFLMEGQVRGKYVPLFVSLSV